jgi:hemerythrin-like domain-containing protein
MITKPSTAPWADEPYKLLPTPNTYKDIVPAPPLQQFPNPKLTQTQNSHSSVFCASEMAHSHNCLLRGLNAILQQGPHIPSSSQPGCKPQDVKDLLFYVEAWTKTVDHHHDTEESTMFPAIEKLAGQPGLMSGPKHQHEEFHSGLVALQDYAVKMKDVVEEYSWNDMKSIIGGVAPSLYRHLEEEIGVILDLEKSCDSEGLKKVWAEAEAVAKANGNLGMLVSLLFLSPIFPSPLLCTWMWLTNSQSTKSFPSFSGPVTRHTKMGMNSLLFQLRCRI